MPIDIRIVSCKEFLRADASGNFDAGASRAHLTQIARECAASGNRRVLLDVRHIDSAPSISELYWLVGSFDDIGFRPSYRLAIVYIDHGMGRARFFADAAHNRGFLVEPFLDFEDAFNWLSQPEEAHRDVAR